MDTCDCREAVWERPGEQHAAGQGPEDASQRGADLPHRPLPWQGAHREPHSAALLQPHLRTPLEPHLHPQRPGTPAFHNFLLFTVFSTIFSTVIVFFDR